MTLDEAIIHCLDKAGDCNTECEKDHAQLAYWLQSYKDILNQDNKKKMTWFDLRKTAYKDFPVLSYEEISKHRVDFRNLFLKGKYFMFMCKELSYYTLFDIKGSTFVAVNEFIDLLSNLDKDIVDIEENGSTGYSIWTRDKDNEVYMYMLFLYDDGVIEC